MKKSEHLKYSWEHHSRQLKCLDCGINHSLFMLNGYVKCKDCIEEMDDSEVDDTDGN